MKKILKQIDYANEILKNGFTKNYRSEWYYLTKLLKMLGYKRSEAKIKLTEYLVDYYKKYDEEPNIRLQVNLANQFDKYWNDKHELTNTSIFISQEEIDFFKGLIGREIPEEVRERRKIKNRTLHIDSVQCLFTIYIYQKVDGALFFENHKQLKQDVGLMTSTGKKKNIPLEKWLCMFYDMGITSYSYSGIVKVLDVPVGEENVEIDTHEFGTWFRNKIGKAVNIKAELICVDCGKPFVRVGNDRRSTRCPECQEEYKRNYDRDRKRRMRREIKHTPWTL